jgi:hypothetical protein
MTINLEKERLAMVSIVGVAGKASKAQWEAACGPLAGEFFGKPINVVRPWSDAVQYLFALPQDVVSRALIKMNAGELAKGLFLSVEQTIDLAGFEAEGAGATARAAIANHSDRLPIPELPAGWVRALARERAA